MPIDDLTARVDALIEEYRLTRDRRLILGVEANREASALWRVIRAVDPATAPAGLKARFSAASVALGWLHYWRYRESPEQQARAELARALLCLEPVSDDYYAVPAELNPLVGRFTDPEDQAKLAMILLPDSSLPASPGAGQDPALLDAGIFLLTAANEALPRHGPGHGDRLARLCLAYHRRHERDGSTTDLDQAITTGEKAMAIAAQHGTNPVESCSDLAFAYWSRHRLRADPADLQRVIDLFERVLALTGPRAALLSDLGTAYRQRYEHTGALAYLERAVANSERAVANSEQAAALPDGHSSLRILTSLSKSLLRRYERSGTRADLLRAAEIGERIVAALPEDDPERGIHLSDVAAILLRRHERSRALEDVNRAVELNEQALSALPDEDPRRPDILGGLAAALHQRYLSVGADTDLNRAVTLGGWALGAISAEHPGWARTSMDLAAIHLTRHTHTGVLADLARAIDLGERVLRSAKTHLPEWFSMLGGAYQQRYPTTGAIADLDRAIDLGEQSLDATDEDDFALSGRQARLATAYWHRHEHATGRSDLDRAIDLGERAVAGTPQDHVDLPGWLSGLAVALLARHSLDKTSADVDAAIDLGERALASVPADHPSRARLTANLCAAYLERVIGEGRTPDPSRLRELAEAVAEARAVAPVDRVAAHHALGTLAQAAGQARLAVTMLDTAAALLPSVAPREAGWADQQHRLGEHFGLVGAGVAAHCAVDDPPEVFGLAAMDALNWAEEDVVVAASPVINSYLLDGKRQAPLRHMANEHRGADTRPPTTTHPWTTTPAQRKRPYGIRTLGDP